MLHILLHFIVPLFVALLFYRSKWRYATVIMVLTMIVDADHLMADPVYDPERCSIGFHPLHTLPAIGFYVLLFVLPLIFDRKNENQSIEKILNILHLAGLGLLIHMALDGIDCLL
tara:strand:+ start:5594 stop:5938 length:345 start_codon:yes stop_codon:yes gene_type:complete